MSAETPPAPKQKSGFAALAVLFAVVFMNMVGFGLVVPLLPFFGDSFHAEPWQVTAMFSAYSLGQFFAEPIWGRISDRVGRKPVLMATTFCNTVGYVALAFAPTIEAAIAIRLFTGLGAGNISSIQGYVADVTPPEKRAGRMGMIGAAFGLGFIVGPGMGGRLVRPELGELGYQLPSLVAAGLTFAACMGVLFFLKESRAKADPAARRPAFLAGFGEATSNPVISRVLLVTMIYMAGFAAMESTFGLWAKARYGWTPQNLGDTFMVIGAVSAVSQALITGRLARLFGEARVLAFGVTLFGSTMLVQVLNHDPHYTAWIVGVGAFGMALAMPNITALISRSTPPDRQGAMLGLNMAAGSSARIFGPVLAGVVFKTVGPDIPFLTTAALCLPAAVMAINAGRVFRQRERAKAQADAA